MWNSNWTAHTKAGGTLVYILTIPTIEFSFKPPIQIDESWMIGLTGLELYNSFFNIAEENKEFELNTDNFDEFWFADLNDALEELFSISDTTLSHLQHEIIGRFIIQA